MICLSRKIRLKVQHISRPTRDKSLSLSLFLIFALLSPLACKPLQSPQISPVGLVVDALPVELEPGKEGPKRPGRLTFLSGFLLKSNDSRFGGLSGLAVSPDGNMLYAVSDAGYWLSARMRHDARGRITQFDRWTIASLLTPEGKPVGIRDRDAEALTMDRDGSFIVAFELVHRLWRYTSPPAGFTMPPVPISTPPELEKAPANEGAEGVTVLPDGRLLAITEDFKNADGSAKAWLIHNGRFDSLSYMASDGFLPTDVTALPNGDLLVLERRYSLLAGVAGRIQRVERDNIRPGAVLRGEEIASFEPPLVVDNFEGIAARRSPDGEILVYIVSDDNYSPFQRTYLLQFRLESETHKSGRN